MGYSSGVAIGLEKKGRRCSYFLAAYPEAKLVFLGILADHELVAEIREMMSFLLRWGSWCLTLICFGSGVRRAEVWEHLIV